MKFEMAEIVQKNIMCSHETGHTVVMFNLLYLNSNTPGRNFRQNNIT